MLEMNQMFVLFVKLSPYICPNHFKYYQGISTFDSPKIQIRSNLLPET